MNHTKPTVHPEEDMPRVREVGRGIPSAEFNNPECLALLRNSKEYSRFHPRMTADGWLIDDRTPDVHVCAMSRKEFMGDLKPVLYRNNRSVRLSLAHYAPIANATTMRVAWICDDELSNLKGSGAVLEFRFYRNGVDYVGWFFYATVSNAFGDRFSHLAACEHEYDGAMITCPWILMQMLGDCAQDRDGNYHYNYYDIPDGLRPGEDDEDDEDDEDGPTGYHETRRRWAAAAQNPDYTEWRLCRNRKALHKRLFGIELEIRAHHGCREEVCNLARGLGFLAEEDSSICSMRGVEVIGEPLTYDQTVDPEGSWGKFLAKAVTIADGWNAGDEYGMHVSLNRMAMSPAVAAKVYASFHGMRDLCIQIAGRHSHSWAKYLDPCLGAGLTGCGVDKYECASVRSYSRIEVRIFKSCLNRDRFIRNVQFCAAVWDWCEQCSLIDCVDQHKFSLWLSTQQHHYPELASFIANLQPKTFKVSSSKVKKLAAIKELHV